MKEAGDVVFLFIQRQIQCKMHYYYNEKLNHFINRYSIANDKIKAGRNIYVPQNSIKI